MKINKICFKDNISDGPGIRTIIYFQGCDIKCHNCHNKAAQDILKGHEFSVQQIIKILDQNCENKKVTISGGEPLMQKDELKELVKKLKQEGYNIVLYTGHDLKEVDYDILNSIDYLKYGPYIETQKTSVTPYVGSKNQKFINVKELRNETKH